MSCITAFDWDSRATHDDQSPQQFAGPGTETKVDLHVSPGRSGKRSRQTYSKYQTAVLETVFQTSKYIVRSKRQQMSAELSLTERQIKIWFQNRRMKEKKCGSGSHHQDAPLTDDRDSAAVGYADDFAISEHGIDYHMAPPLSGCDLGGDSQENAFANFYHGPVVRHRPQPPPQVHDTGVGYAGYEGCDAGGYDLLTQHDALPYAAEVKQQHLWTPTTNVVDQDFFGDHDLDHFQRFPAAHHHHHHHHHRPLMNSQVQDYCPPQLQAAHGY